MPDDVAARLEAALGGTRGEPVDSASLLRGARQGAVRLRRRRSAGVAVALAAVVVAPLGWAGAAGNLSLPGSDPGQEAAVSADLRSGAGPSSSAVPSSPGPSLPRQSSGATDVPGLTSLMTAAPTTAAPTTPDPDLSAVLLSQSDLPQGWREIPSPGKPYLPVPGQRCAVSAEEQLEGAAQLLLGATEQDTLQASVTVWPAGTGPQEYTRVEQNTGLCRFVDSGVQQAWTPSGGGPGFVRSWSEDDVDNALAVVLVQDTLVGVWSQGPAGSAGVDELAEQGAEIVAERVRAGG